MSNKIGLRDAIRLIDSSDDPMELIENPELLQFMDDVQDAGQNILSPLDEDYLIGAIGFLKSDSIAGFIATGGNMMLAMSLMDSGDYDKLVTFIFKFCVGLSAIEELR